jgi:sugar phosphate isomerase/epimerase
MKTTRQSRRRFLKIIGAGAAFLASADRSPAQIGSAGKQNKTKQKFELGLASYTLREFNLEQTLAMTRRVGLKNICFKSMHLPLDSTPEQIRETVQKVKDAGLNLYGGGVIYMRDENQVNNAFDYAKAAGMKVIVGVPQPELLPLVNDKVRQYDIKVAIHNHGPTDKVYPTPTSIIEKINKLDKRIGLCIDIGHTMRCGVDPAIPARKYADRLIDLHIKDVSAADRNGHAVEMGRGIIDMPEFFETLINIGYDGFASFEYEKDGKDPLAGLAESVGYARGVLAAIG